MSWRVHVVSNKRENSIESWGMNGSAFQKKEERMSKSMWDIERIDSK